jgi:hypothetical protein
MRRQAPMSNASLADRIEIANRELTEAERALDTLLQTMEVVSHTETTPVTKVVEDAFARIKAARVRLLELRKLLSKPPE